ncbi:MAG: hypothetical protein J5863_06595 [Desulfovibrio sp.]|nr:hypothetical protein [Desulfovibrio sp.]
MKHFASILLVVCALALACVLEASARQGPYLPQGACLNGRDEFDWSLVPRISDKPSLAAYLHACVEARLVWIPVAFAKGFYLEPLDVLANYLLLPWSSDKTVYQHAGERHVVYEVRYYPGMRVADAYRQGDLAGLSTEERRLYEAALPIVHEAMLRPTPLQRELFIHDRIVELASYGTGDTGTMPRHATAFGVLLDGTANCQGYADAFYMLGRMCGLKVDFMAGRAAGGGHTWNAIELDGRSYVVDATWDDDSFGMNGASYTTYIYFNAPREIAQATHQWDPGCEPPNLAELIDGRYFYATPEHQAAQGRFFGSAWHSAQECLESMAEDIARFGWRMHYAMVPCDKAWSQSERANSYLLDALTRLDWHGQTSFAVTTNSGWRWMFYTVDARRQ